MELKTLIRPSPYVRNDSGYEPDGSCPNQGKPINKPSGRQLNGGVDLIPRDNVKAIPGPLQKTDLFQHFHIFEHIFIVPAKHFSQGSNTQGLTVMEAFNQ